MVFLAVYLGLVTVGVFLFHSRFKLPDSPIEWILLTLFVVIVLSGLIGIGLSKFVPHRLEARGEHVLFERIPMYRAQLAERAEALALSSVRGGTTKSIAQFYSQELAGYFARHHNTLAHLVGSGIPKSRMLGALQAIERAGVLGITADT